MRENENINKEKKRKRKKKNVQMDRIPNLHKEQVYQKRPLLLLLV